MSKLKAYWLGAIISTLLVVTVFLLILVVYREEIRNQLSTLQIGQAQIKVEIAATLDQWRQGLSGREQLLPGRGMLFIFPQSLEQHFWMHGMKFSLDFIWINNGKVVQLNSNIPPPQAEEQPQLIMAKQPINMVLEAPAGWIEKNNIKIGDQVFLLVVYP